MYLQITDRCNMHCEHCSFSCTAQGEDMSLETFRNAKEYILGDCLAIGGGEPTLHPMFWQILGECLGTCGSVWLATNGSVDDIAIPLAAMARKGVIGCALSQDDYHDPVSEEVLDAFYDGMQWDNGIRQYLPERGWQGSQVDLREIRDVSRNIGLRGRALENELEGGDKCTCPELFIAPNGDVRGCACPDAPLFGNVNTEVHIPEGWEYGECSREQEETVRA